MPLIESKDRGIFGRIAYPLRPVDRALISDATAEEDGNPGQTRTLSSVNGSNTSVIVDTATVGQPNIPQVLTRDAINRAGLVLATHPPVRVGWQNEPLRHPLRQAFNNVKASIRR